MADDVLFHELPELKSQAALSRLERRRASARERMRQRRAEFPERERARQARWRAENRERDNEIARQSRARRKAKDPAAWNAKAAEKKRAAYRKNPQKHLQRDRLLRLARPEYYREIDRRSKIKSTYGITWEERDKMFVSQGEACAICESKEPRHKRGWHIDHCHTTGRVRAILCNACNAALGYAKDSPAILRKMAAYIERHAGAAKC